MSDYVDDVLYEIQHGGFAQFIELGASDATGIAQNWGNPAAAAHILDAVSPQSRDLVSRLQAKRGLGQRLQTDSLAPQYGCPEDAAGLFFVGTAFVVLSIMSGGSFDVFLGAEWEAFSLWGGIGVGAWGAGHAMICGF